MWTLYVLVAFWKVLWVIIASPPSAQQHPTRLATIELLDSSYEPVLTFTWSIFIPLCSEPHGTLGSCKDYLSQHWPQLRFAWIEYLFHFSLATKLLKKELVDYRIHLLLLPSMLFPIECRLNLRVHVLIYHLVFLYQIVVNSREWISTSLKQTKYFHCYISYICLGNGW